jgi:hypothetical protein
MSPDCQRLTLRAVRRTHSIIDSQGLVEASVCFRLPQIPSRWSVQDDAEPVELLRQSGELADLPAQPVDAVDEQQKSATEPFDTGSAAGRVMLQMLGVFRGCPTFCVSGQSVSEVDFGRKQG